VPHAIREMAIGGFDEPVVMVVHQAVRMAKPMIARDDVLQSLQEEVAALGIVVDGEAGVPARGDMVESAWECQAQGSGQGGSITSLTLYFKT
jgi:hypothetical protein